MDTGLIDSHTHLGINMPSIGRVSYRKVSTCSPITTDGFVIVSNYSAMDRIGVSGDRIRHYQYGSWEPSISTDTFVYNQHAFVDNYGYQLTWVPLKESHAQANHSIAPSKPRRE